jgi:hypothetical protein
VCCLATFPGDPTRHELNEICPGRGVVGVAGVLSVEGMPTVRVGAGACAAIPLAVGEPADIDR